MNRETEGLSYIQDLTDDELELFKMAVHTLLTKTFILRGIEKEEKLYDFTIRNAAMFDAWFSCMDAVIIRDESLGVVCFRGSGDTRVRLGKDETCALLVLRQLYEEKRAELSLSAFPSVTVEDFVSRYNAMTGGEIKKTSLTETLRRLQSFKLIDVLSQEVSDDEALLLLYPSIAVSIDRDSIEDLLRALSGEEP
jgi:hypothetical protein